LPQGWVSICQKGNQYIQIIMNTIIDGSRCSMDIELEWVSTSFGHAGKVIQSDLVAVMHNQCIESRYRPPRMRHGHFHIVSMTFNRTSTIFGFTSWVVYIPISCSHPLMRYWRPCVARVTAARSLPPPEHEHHRSQNDFWRWILGNEGIVQILDLITELLITVRRKNANYTSRITDSRMDHIAYRKTSKRWLLDAE